MGANNWYIENANLVLNTSDDASGISQKGMSTSSKVNYNNVTASLQRNTKGTTYYGYVKDEAGNVGSCNLNVKVDSTPPEISFSISGIDTAIMTCSDDTSGINGKTNYNQRLIGTRDYTVNQTCTNNAGISATDSHTYDYSTCADTHIECRPGCGTYYSDCASGSNTCRPGYEEVCTTVPVCTGGYTTTYKCLSHIGSTDFQYTTNPPSGWNIPGSNTYGLCSVYKRICNHTSYEESCTAGNYDPCHSGSNTCKPGYVTDPSTCDSCYYREEVCEGGFLY